MFYALAGSREVQLDAGRVIVDTGVKWMKRNR
jgi:hypothetical protein